MKSEHQIKFPQQSAWSPLAKRSSQTPVGLHRTMFFRAPVVPDELAEPPAAPAYDLDAALHLFVALIKGLSEVHKRVDLHQAVCLANLRLLADGSVEFRNDATVPLAYSSPEQTGRMNRQVDYRSDYYSLCLLYTSPSPRDQRGSRMPSSA